ncbi:decaprenyl-phosphate phosphoribosyltransferase [Actinoplanes sp. TBRC 11911]|uniref:decaprenyl-phosphate phosphoribosyltransferase n=1 Tax=Actinoplanes sp. TBRC 11911 TaxID=2729386 RepID=UPI00145F5D13|nr:decaprenyl-phosphate phosphoribosyltransferase [Actinoplanes sp. TBRC 11911]NMO53729.1 decaprenyl-phosphate phosphoribosyltransferase [Actinoplanes sp. TBRC 11911]
MSAPTLPGLRPLPLPARATVLAILQTARPRQWIKNVLVFAAPASTGVLFTAAALRGSLLAFLIFTLAAAGTYFVNDAADADIDRTHPVKSRRPVAAGLISRSAARWAGYGSSAAALLLAGTVNWQFVACVAGYLALTGAYSAGLKHVPVLDVLIVGAGFLLRAVGGAAATGTTASNWFLLLILFGSLYLVIAKRAGELSRAVPDTGRRVLAGYSAPWLQQVLTMTLTGTVLTYAVWALQYRGADATLPLLAVSLVPFLAALMRYSLLVAKGAGEAPETVFTSDRFLLAAGVVWAATAGGALYLG